MAHESAPIGRRVSLLWEFDGVPRAVARCDARRSRQSGIFLPSVRPEADRRMTDDGIEDIDEALADAIVGETDQQGIEGHVALETWSGRVNTQIYGDGELQIHGPYYQHSEDDDAYIRLSLTLDDCEYDDNGGGFTFSIGLASAGVLATLLQDAQEREPEVLLGEIGDTDAGEDGDSA